MVNVKTDKYEFSQNLNITKDVKVDKSQCFSGHRLGLGEHRDLSTLTSFVMFKLEEHLFLTVLAFSVSTLTNSV